MWQQPLHLCDEKVSQPGIYCVSGNICTIKSLGSMRIAVKFEEIVNYTAELGSNTLQLYLIAMKYIFCCNCNAIVFE